MPDPSTSQPDSNSAPDARGRPYLEDDVSLLDLLLVVVRGRRLIGVTIAAFAVLGFIAALAPSAEYVAEAEIIPEVSAGRGGSSGLAALRRFGIDLGGGGSEGLDASTYPRVLEGREVRLAVVRDTFYIGRLDTTSTYVDYANQPKGLIEKTIAFVMRYTINLPQTILKAFEEETPSRDRAVTTPGSQDEVMYPTAREERAMAALSDLITLNSETGGVIILSIVTEDPHLSTELAESFIQHSSERIRTMRTQKERDNLAFIEEQFAQAEEELRVAEEELAAFLDRNNNPQTARLRTEQQRLERQVSFKSDLYSSLQEQVSQARIDLQRSAPVFTVLEEPVPPQRPSGPNRVVILFFVLFLGGAVGIGGAFVKAFVNNQSLKADAETRAKLEEIKSVIVPKRIMKKVSAQQKERPK